MNSTDLQSLLANQPVSRTTFFTQLLVVPRPQHETPSEDLSPNPHGAAELTALVAAPPQPTSTGFAA